MTEDHLEPGRTGVGRGVVAVVAVLALALGVTLGWAVTRQSGPTVPDFGVDAGFARDMQKHHLQAVEMSFIVRDRTQDPAVRTLAFDIITSQQQQAGQMYGWLRQWGLPQTGSSPEMAWVGGEHAAHVEAGQPMPGLATPEQLDDLRAASGVEAERLFLELMIAHHRGGVDMAIAAVADARTDEVRSLARAMENAQSAEITLMEGMLEERAPA
ncbi:DUF305 domain-containing protein [Phycicoccus sp. BSK3Z-2]|uniref:DUF305 domain-containing protein n=1 Tax=Phycicoccus avicenniae TaxID=2828860 RepID=A0A941D8A8_9MICO|nr:DUF305 domain-containing protein [Phycicoccus avicenniae]MBR7742337.1 DUF305 domain-containing protein [Phycicoccus avicenniae]